MNIIYLVALTFSLLVGGCSEPANEKVTSTPAREARDQAAHDALLHQDSDTVKTVPRQYRIRTITPPAPGDTKK